MLSRRSFFILGGAAALGVGAFGAGGIGRAPAQGQVQIAPPEAFTAASEGRLLLVDIRRPEEWAATGVAAPALRLDMRDPEFIEKLRAARSSDTQPVAVICARGVRSARTARRLDAAGITPIIDVPEGMLGSAAGPGWLARGLPLTKS